MSGVITKSMNPSRTKKRKKWLKIIKIPIAVTDGAGGDDGGGWSIGGGGDCQGGSPCGGDGGRVVVMAWKEN